MTNMLFPRAGGGPVPHAGAWLAARAGERP